MKAYGSSVAQALAQAQRYPFIARKSLQISFSFDRLGVVNQCIQRYQAEQLTIEYTEQVIMTIAVAQSRTSDFCRELSNVCSGQIEFRSDSQ